MSLALVLSLLAVVYNNAINHWEPFQRGAYVPANLAFAGVVTLAAAWSLDLSAAELGLGGDLGSTAIVVGTVALFAVGMLLVGRSRYRRRIADQRVAGLRGSRLGYHVLARIPLGTAVTEEVVFRGVLFSSWLANGYSDRQAALYAAVAFGLWHVTPTIVGVRLNDRDASAGKLALAVVGALVVTTGVGLGLTWLRVETGGLLAPMVLHGGINSTAAYAAALAHRRAG